MRKYKNLSYESKKEVYDEIENKFDTQVYQERSDFMLMKIDKSYEQDIDNTFESISINKPQNMCFSYILDSGAEWKKYENTDFFNHIDVLNEL